MIKTDTNKLLIKEAQITSQIEEMIAGIQKFDTVEETEKDEEMDELAPVINDSEILLTIINEQARFKRMWQIAAVCLTIFAVVFSFVYFGLHVNYENQAASLSRAEVNVQKANGDSMQARQKVETLQNQLAKSKAELEHTQVLQSNSKLEVDSLQKQLSDTSGRLRVLRKRNVEAVKRLSGRLEKLSGPGQNN